MGDAVRVELNPDERLEPWAELLPVIEQLSLARTIDNIAETVRHAARRLSGADGITFVLRDGGHCHYLDEYAIGPLWKGQRFPLETCISGWCMLNNKTAVIPDIYQDERIPQAAYRPTFVKSLVMTPVRGSDNPPAAIGAYWRTMRTPSQDEVDILAALARSTAIAIENVKLLSSLESAATHAQNQAREMEMLYHSAQAAEMKARVLYDELQHRVKNNLTTIVAITQLQIRHSQDERVKAELGNTQRRVLAVAALHSRMVRDESTAFHFSRYVQEVCDGIKSSLLRDGRVTLNVNVEDAPVEIARAMSLGLIVNELVANAARHGFGEGQGGTIDVTFASVGADYVLTIRDDGAGHSEAGIGEKKGLGLRLAESCVRQIGGTMEIAGSGKGTVCVIRAPIDWNASA